VAHSFEIVKDKAGEFRVRFKHSNGNLIFQTEGYSDKRSATSIIESIKANAPGAPVHDATKAASAT
jgi:uncharacterized protein